MNRLRSTVALALALGTLAGCAHRKTPPPPAAPVEVVTPPPAVETPTPVADETPAGLPADIAELNDYLRRNGLLRDVGFDFDQSTLSAEARDILAANARFLAEHGDLLLSVEGHCDERGTSEYNLALGQRRADAAKNYLGSLGVDAGRLSTVSYGEERPLCTASDESCWSQNRRAHFVVTGRRAG